MKTEPRIILITGAGAGIGAALTRECLQRGAVVYAGVRNMSRAESDFADLKDTPGLRIIELDVNDPAHGERAIDTITGEQGRLDVLSTTPATDSTAYSKSCPKQACAPRWRPTSSRPCA